MTARAHEQGFTLLGALVALAAIGVLVALLAGHMAQTVTVRTALEKRLDYLAVDKTLAEAIRRKLVQLARPAPTCTLARSSFAALWTPQLSTAMDLALLSPGDARDLPAPVGTRCPRQWPGGAIARGLYFCLTLEPGPSPLDNWLAKNQAVAEVTYVPWNAETNAAETCAASAAPQRRLRGGKFYYLLHWWRRDDPARKVLDHAGEGYVVATP